jgi:hypothetical protein
VPAGEKKTALESDEMLAGQQEKFHRKRFHDIQGIM